MVVDEDDSRHMPVGRLAKQLADAHLSRGDIAPVDALLGEDAIASVQQRHVQLLSRERTQLDGQSVPDAPR
jgi:hypothetical protein